MKRRTLLTQTARSSRILFASAAMLLGAWACTVGAADPKSEPKPDVPAGPDPAALFTRLDADKDGTVTATEAGTDNETLFNRLLRLGDKNKDGKLSREEFVGGLTQKETPAPVTGGASPGGAGGMMPDPEMMFKRLDANKDSKVTLDEVPAERKEIFERGMARFDKDSDKSLSLTEFKEMMSGMSMGGRPGGEMLKKIMEGDKNGDGKLSKEEAPERMRQQFEKIDADKDGYLQKEEIVRRLAAMAEKGKGKGLEKKLEKKKKAE